MDNEAYVSDTLDVSDTVKTSTVKSTFAQFVATFITGLSAVSVGLLYTSSAVVIKSVYKAEEGLSLNDEQASWYASFLPIAQPVGCFLGGYLQKYIGRIQGLVIMNLSTIISWMVLYAAFNPEMLYLSSYLMGLSIGFVEAPAVIYVSEITTPPLRGIFVSYFVCNCTIGIASVYFFALFMHWRTICLIAASLSLASILLMAILPDSPTWLLNNDKEKQALRALRWLRGWASEEQVKREFDSLRQQIKNLLIEGELNDSGGEASWKERLRIDELLHASTLRPFIFAIIFHFFSAAAVIIGARSYLLVIFKKLNEPINPTSLALYSWISSIFGNIFSCFLIKRFGKRKISLISMFLSASMCVLMGLCITFQDELNQPMIIVVLFICLGFANYLGVCFIPWILLGEIFPAKIRSLATGIAGAIFYISISIYVKTYIYLELLLTTQGVFILYGILSFAGLFHLWIYMPETEGKTMVEIEELFMDDARKTCPHFRKKK